MRRGLLSVMLTVVAVAACGDNLKKPPPTTPPGGGGAGGEPPEVVTCRTLPASANTCDLTPGNQTTLLQGTVLTPTKVYLGGQVAVDETGHIACVGCDCGVGGETTITCPDAAISPGLINTHDHITYTQNSPYGASTERYEDRQQWRIGQDQHPKITYDSGASTDQVRWGELRFLMAGATSIVGSGGAAGLLRNLDQTANEEGLGHKAVDFETFPLDDADGTKRTGDCNYGDKARTEASVASVDSFEPHTSEGIDATARNEFLCETSSTYDTMTPGVSQNFLLNKTAMIHAIGLLAKDYDAMGQAGTGLIWSPRSNISLYGETARVTTAARFGVQIALGTDWMPSGSMNLLRELACADSFNATYLGKFFRDDQLWDMVTFNAAAVTGTGDAIGLLATGMVADIAIFASHGKAPYRTVIEARPADIALVMRGGKILYGDDALVGALAQTCDTVDVCGTSKRVCLMSEIGKTYAALQTAAKLKSGADIYPAFSCDVPMDEPSCVPARSMSVDGSTVYDGMVVSMLDSDGDGVPDASDNCQQVFNPVRPVDMGSQGDADSDGKGDACDPCPFDAQDACDFIDPNDSDRDGMLNFVDNCPDTPNPDQADTDQDGKGNACDACPAFANPGKHGCPHTIYEVKDGTVPFGTPVLLTNALVTGRGNNGFFVQVKTGDDGDRGPDNSGVFVFTSSAPSADAAVGARVSIEGTVTNFSGQIELDSVLSVKQTAAGPELPAPVSVSYDEIKTGGARAATLEGVVVSLPAASITKFDTPVGEATLTDAANTNTTLIFDDFVFALAPVPEAGEKVVSVSGILARRQNASKLEPRSPEDFVFDSPRMDAFGPALSFARLGSVGETPTFPQPLKVTLRRPAHGDTTISLTSDNAAVTVSDVVIPDRGTEATVLVTVSAPLLDATLTATLSTQSPVQVLTAHVRVLDTAEDATTVTLSPTSLGIRPLDMVPITASLDLPALADTLVTLAVAPASAGTLPATITIAAGQIATTFTFVNQSAAGTTITITATGTFGGTDRTSTSTLNVGNVATHLVISQVYGAGGNTGALRTNDFIELYNPTASPISLAGLSLEYAAATGTSWTNITALPDTITVPPGGYVLVQESGGANGAALPTPDVIGNPAISMAAGAGKVALVTGTTALTGACPISDTRVIDFVGYGSTASCSEGNHPTPAPSATLSVFRADSGCSDTDDNARDFTAAAPAPRNSATAPHTCQ